MGLWWGKGAEESRDCRAIIGICIKLHHTLLRTCLRSKYYTALVLIWLCPLDGPRVVDGGGMNAAAANEPRYHTPAAKELHLEGFRSHSTIPYFVSFRSHN